jgi:fructokinase
MSETKQIVALGEILWDLFPDGPRFGGAPANFACHAAQLGGAVALVSAVGDDDLGRAALRELADRQIDLAEVQVSSAHPTGIVQVSIDGAGKPSYEFRADVAWDHLAWRGSLKPLAERAAAVCFGTLAQRGTESHATIQRFVRETQPDALRIFDVNLRKEFHSPEIIRQSLELANVCKLNDEELPHLARLFGLTGNERQQLAALGARFQLQLVALTRGAQGALLWRQTGEISEQPGIATTIVDTVGAGDAFTAVLTVGLLAGRPLDEINRRACRVAAFVCSQAGATPRLPQEFRDWP